jgi:hypothetical protein
MPRVPAFLLACFLTVPLFAVDSSEVLLTRAWPYQTTPRVTELGRGIGIVFSPDLSVPGNCRFYASLGFACFDEPDWDKVLQSIALFNEKHTDRPIQTLLLETHGTNGNGLKLQRSYEPKAARSYISVGGLQQRVETMGVQYVVISACNSGRLLRPSIYLTLDPKNGDKLFLPATRGIINATPQFDPASSDVVVLTPVASHIETSLVGKVRELGPSARTLIAKSAAEQHLQSPKQFAVSDMLIQILLHDPRLQVTTGAHVDELSRDIDPQSMSEGLFSSFVAYLNSLAVAELPAPPTKTATKTKSTRATR